MVKLHWESYNGFVNHTGYRSQTITLGKLAKNNLLNNGNNYAFDSKRGRFHISYNPVQKVWYLSFINTDKSDWIFIHPKGAYSKSGKTKDGFKSSATAKAKAQRMVE